MRNPQAKDPKIVSLIQNVRNNIELYDYRLRAHHDNALKDKLWEKVAEKSGMASAAEAKMYWKNLHYSFTVFYRNELIRLVRANYDERDIGAIPAETRLPEEQAFGNRPWGYYSDMRFIAPFRVKGTDPELDRLIELAKPIVYMGTNKLNSAAAAAAAAAASTSSATGKALESALSCSSRQGSELLLGMEVPEIKNEDLSVDDMCLRSFFDSLYRSTRVLPGHLQRRVKQEMLLSLNQAEAELDSQ